MSERDQCVLGLGGFPMILDDWRAGRRRLHIDVSRP